MDDRISAAKHNNHSASSCNHGACHCEQRRCHVMDRRDAIVNEVARDDVVGDQEGKVDVQYLYSAPGPGASEHVHSVARHGGSRQTQAHASWLRRRRAKLPLRDPAGRMRDLGISD